MRVDCNAKNGRCAKKKHLVRLAFVVIFVVLELYQTENHHVKLGEIKGTEIILSSRLLYEAYRYLIND